MPLRHCDGKDASYNTHLRLAGYRYYQGHVRQATELSVPFWRRQRLGATAAVALLAQASYVGHRFLSLYSYYSMHRIVQELVVLRRLPLAPAAERQTPWHWQCVCHWHAVNFFAQLTIQCTGYCNCVHSLTQLRHPGRRVPVARAAAQAVCHSAFSCALSLRRAARARARAPRRRGRGVRGA